MSIFAVLYEYTDDAEARDRHRAPHRAFLAPLVDEGVLISSGPTVEDDRVGALLLLRQPSAEAVAELLNADPFIIEGVVAKRRILDYTVVFGSLDGK
ncbi:hypothetical protein FVA74_13315 [Salinibacterium sp. dk2585]|uniref:YciI family protein n=1 Tax=unclassified Salinibacterium TaxID=2632331 RepID=UPI0011C24B05|nr:MULTISPECIES: YciI family protein [unclassified Salinibacterium]QEE62442.1 hypothetical protein FVA74_13315 [Salinibacterium sp. dk2585]TXK52675.1 hypothetical protein FVP63_12080 [Salinibacterium sp. dk5596]